MNRFWEKVNKAASNGCWEWTAALKDNGYGTFRASKAEGMKYAHRVSYELHFGPIPKGLYVCHKCDNRKCVNPAHLWVGTHEENQQDMGRKGRTHSPAKRLSDNTIREIRAAAAQSKHKDVAKRFGISRSYVNRIANGVRRGGV